MQWRHFGLVVSASNFQPEGWWFEPGLCHHVVSLDKKLCSTLSLSAQVYKWVQSQLLLKLQDNINIQYHQKERALLSFPLIFFTMLMI